MRKTDISNPFADDLRGFDSTAKSIRAYREGDSAMQTPSMSLNTSVAADVTLQGEPIGRRGRQQQQQQPAAVVSTPVSLPASFATSRRQNNMSTASMPLLQGVSSIADNWTSQQSPSQRALFPNGFTSTDSTSVFPVTGMTLPASSHAVEEPTGLAWFDDDGGGASPAAKAGTSSTAAAAVPNALQLELEKKDEEKRELYAELGALNLEIDALEAKMTTTQLQEETILLDLETERLVKGAEKLKAEEELEDTLKEVKAQGLARLSATVQRNEEELTQTLRETEEAEELKYKTRLKKIEESLKAATATVESLREQAALLRQSQPYDPRSILLSMREHQEATATPAGEGEATEGTAEERLSARLDGALHVLRQYCDERCNELRRHVVDYIHAETLKVAHQVRAARETAWLHEAVSRKQTLAAFMSQSLDRYKTFFRERATRKSQHSTAVIQLIKARSEQLRQSTTERLSAAVAKVNAELKVNSQKFDLKFRETIALQEEKLGRVRKSNAELALTQLGELDARHSVESATRKQLHGVEKKSAEDQLLQWRSQRDRDAWAEIRSKTQRSLEDSISNVRNAFRSLKEEVVREHQACKRPPVVRGSEDDQNVLTMKIQEQQAVLEMLSDSIDREQKQCRMENQQCGEALRKVSASLSDAVDKVTSKRQTQRSHEAQVDLQVTMWESEHRKALSAPIQLALPTTSGSAARVTTHNHALSMVSCLLSDVTDSVVRVTADMEKVAEVRKRLFQSPSELVSFMQKHVSRVGRAWEGVMGATLSLQEALAEKAMGEAKVKALEEYALLEQRSFAEDEAELREDERRLETVRASVEGDFTSAKKYYQAAYTNWAEVAEMERRLMRKRAQAASSLGSHSGTQNHCDDIPPVPASRPILRADKVLLPV